MVPAFLTLTKQIGSEPKVQRDISTRPLSRDMKIQRELSIEKLPGKPLWQAIGGMWLEQDFQISLLGKSERSAVFVRRIGARVHQNADAQASGRQDFKARKFPRL